MADVRRINKEYKAMYEPLNFFNSSISGDVLTPGIYIPQLLSCVSRVLLHGLSVHFGCDAMLAIIAANCFSIDDYNDEFDQTFFGCFSLTNSQKDEPFESSIFCFAMPVRLSITPKFRAEVS